MAIDPQEQVSLMINEEDHLRVQVMHSGLDLRGAWEQINRVDDLIEERVTYAFHEFNWDFNDMRGETVTYVITHHKAGGGPSKTSTITYLVPNF